MKTVDKTWLDNCDVQTQLTIAVTWFLDKEEGVFFESLEDLIDSIESVVKGKTEHFSPDNWWTFYDALGLFAHIHQSAELAEIYEIANRGYHGQLPEGPTKCFAELDEDEDEDNGDILPFDPSLN